MSKVHKQSFHAGLMLVTLLMGGALIANLAGLALDSRSVIGAPAWLKPAKFAVSSGIFSLTLGWILPQLRSRFAAALGWVIAAVLTLEVGLIDVQAYRGVASHFNVRTLLDGTIYAVMGVSIAGLWLALLCITVMAFRQVFENPVMGTAIRTALLVSLLGTGIGGLMTRATASQRASLESHQPVLVVGAHTVGAVDGGPGLPITAWSTQHGDLRIPHFLGMHALQFFLLLGWVLDRRLSGSGTQQLVVAAGASYISIVAVLTWQALRGQSILHPDTLTLAVVGVWLTATALATLVATGAPRLRFRRINA